MKKNNILVTGKFYEYIIAKYVNAMAAVLIETSIKVEWGGEGNNHVRGFL